jgi:multidrug resistance protein, MATE family
LLIPSHAGLPLGIWLTFKRDFGLHGLWIGLSISLTYAAVLGVYLCLRTNWDREVEKAADRLAADSKDAGEGPCPPARLAIDIDSV